MKISEFIVMLERFKSEVGDLPVTVFDSDKLYTGELEEVPSFIVLGLDEDEKPKNIIICDEDTADAFYDGSEED